MKETCENDKKAKLGFDFGLFDPNLLPQIFFRGFYLYQMLGIVASYHGM